jgi:hypothetical protein
VRDRLDLTTQVARHRASVVAETLVERSLEPLTAVSVRNNRSIQARRSQASAPTVPASGLMSSASHGGSMSSGDTAAMTAAWADRLCPSEPFDVLVV